MTYIIQASPRKVVPLAGGSNDMQRTRSEQAALPTRRMYNCGVVLEPMEQGQAMVQDTDQLVASLGNIISSGQQDKLDMPRSTSAPSMVDISNEMEPSNGRKRALTSTSAYTDVLNELVHTERSYVAKLRTLKTCYADPLRKFARRKEEAILPLYEAKTLFGNVDAILPANEAFLKDLEDMMLPNGSAGGVGDVALKHIRDLKAFDCYKQYYAKREEAQKIFEEEMMKRGNTGFKEFIERVQYSADGQRRVGLRELLMEPIQRIPRYTLLFRTMIKLMSPADPQRGKLMEADECAARIAHAETDEQTRRRTIMYCLEKSIEGFPPNLISNSRTFVDCIDVDDVPDAGGVPFPSSGDSVANSAPLPCTLFLFDDRLLIVKRPSPSAPGRTLSGLDEMDRAMRNGGIPINIKKGSMSCKGVVDVTDLVATDVGGADFHLFIEQTLSDQTSERWSNRPFRAYSVAHPPAPPNFDPIRCQNDKNRFLENLWKMQALYRSKNGVSIARLSEERDLTGRSIARTCFNVYTRKEWLKEPKKNKIVLHIDPMGDADPLPFGLGAAPFVIVRVQPMAGDLCRYVVTSSDASDEGEEDIIHTGAVPSRVAQTIHQFGLFKFKTGRSSVPGTPGALGRPRSAVFSLDSISRNLFNASSSIRSSEVFGSMTMSRRRILSGVSRSSTITTGTSSTESSSAKLSQRSNSTAGTSVISAAVEDDDGKWNSTGRKLVKRGRSPGGTSGPDSGSELDRDKNSTSSNSRRGRKSGRLDVSPSPDDNDATSDEGLGDVTIGDSEWNLSMRLELARQNSQIQQSQGQSSADSVGENSIMHNSDSTMAQSGSSLSYNEESRARSPPPRSMMSFTESMTPTPSMVESLGRPQSIYSVTGERRPMGPRNPPRSPSATRPPTPNQRPPSPHSNQPMSFDSQSLNQPTTPTHQYRGNVLSLDHDLPPVPPFPLEQIGRQPTLEELERAVSPVASRRLLFETSPVKVTFPSANPSSISLDTKDAPVVVEPLTIKKRKAVPSLPGPSSPPSRPTGSSSLQRTATGKRLSVQAKTERNALASAITIPDLPLPIGGGLGSTSMELWAPDEILTLARSTRVDVESSHRTLKKIKLEIHSLQRSLQTVAPISDHTSRVKSPGSSIPRSPQSRQLASKIVDRDARMEEMRQMLKQRNGRGTPTNALDDAFTPNLPGLVALDENARMLESLIVDADQSLASSLDRRQDLEGGIARIIQEYIATQSEKTKLDSEVGRLKRQCEVLKKLLADATAENDIMYESFNEELDGMFNDVNLPETEAWQAMSHDLKETKASRNKLASENTVLKRKLEEAEQQNKDWEVLLRSHGLIS